MGKENERKSLIEKLNEKQLESITNTEGYLRVIAGAGSGKTKMLVNRYIYIIKELGISSKNILCLTFSNKAATEMKERIRKILGGEPDVSYVTTYHGLGARIIKDHSDKLFFSDNFQIIDQIDQKSILGEIYDELGLRLDNGSFEKILEEIGIFKADLTYIKEMRNPKNDNLERPCTNITKDIIRRYLLKQKKSCLVDFEDLINYSIYLLKNFDSIRNEWQDRVNYVQVDEFQDSDDKEMQLVDLISGKYKNVMIVGDPDQNIYEWRGSNMELLVQYDITHVPTTTVVMNQNYRSTKKILRCANTLIANNKNRYPKDLFSLNEDGEDVIYFRAKNDYQEADWVVNRLKFLKEMAKENYSDIAILYRSSYSSRVVESKLIENGIPYEIKGNVKFFQRMEIKDVLAYMKVVAFNDDYALRRIINVPKRKFGKIKRGRLNSLQSEGVSLFDTLKDNIEVLAKGTEGLKDFVQTIDYLRQNKDNMNALEIFEELMKKTNYETYIRELGNMERFNNLVEFRRVILDLLADDKNASIEECLSYFALQTDKEELTDDKVKLMTIHASKGLEFKNVFVIGMNEGVFPSSKTIEERQEAGLEEERRLCYVALTRAKNRLFLTNAETYTHEGVTRTASRFLVEIGTDNYQSLGEKSKEVSQFKKATYSINDKVKHRILGVGEIINIDYSNNSYKIKFEKYDLPRNIDMDYEFDEVTISDNSVIIPEVITNDCDLKNAIEIEVSKETLELNSPEMDETIESKEFLEEIEDITIKDDEKKDLQIEVIKNDFNISLEDLKDISDSKNYDNINVDSLALPQTGWSCVGISDFKDATLLCNMCHKKLVRFVHYMKHPDVNRILMVGCVCAGRMEGNEESASFRENNYKGRLSRKNTFLKKKWRLSSKGHPYIKVRNDIYLMYFINEENKWILFINGKTDQKKYNSREEIINDVFEYLEKK